MDSILILPPGPSAAGSQLQIGTYLMADPGADYGAKGLISSMESSNALRDGGVFAYRSVGPRKMSFPLLLRDVSGQTLLQTESLLREWTTAGAAVAVQPETIPSGQAVFFDVLDGRWEPDYDTFENRAGRRKGTLFLDTQPWGYWPTEMLLASAASVGYMGQLAVSGASVIGDVAPLAHLLFNPTIASTFNAVVGSGYAPDMLAFSLSARASFQPFIGASSFQPSQPLPNTNITPSLGVADKFSPASIAKVPTVNGSYALSGWFMAADSGTAIASILEPAYRGRFRAFAYVRCMPSTQPWQILLDADRFVPSPVFADTNLYSPQAMASGNQIASAYSFASQAGGQQSGSPGYAMLDMGEITLPPSGSGIQGGVRLRLWAQPPPVFVGTAQLAIGGIYLLPVDGAAGLLSRGLYTPTISYGANGLLELNSGFADSVNILQPVPGGGTARFAVDGRAFYRGVAPRIGATVQQLNFVTADRAPGNGGGGGKTTWKANVEFSQVSVSYRPTFQFLAGL